MKPIGINCRMLLRELSSQQVDSSPCRISSYYGRAFIHLSTIFLNWKICKREWKYLTFDVVEQSMLRTIGFQNLNTAQSQDAR